MFTKKYGSIIFRGNILYFTEYPYMSQRDIFIAHAIDKNNVLYVISWNTYNEPTFIWNKPESIEFAD